MSGAKPQALAVVEGLPPHGRAAHLAQYVDLETCAVVGEGGRHVTCGQTLAYAVPESARGYVADRGAVFHDRLVADDLGIERRDLHDDEAAFGSRGAFGQHGRAAGEVRLAEVDEAVEPGLGGGVIRPEILLEGAVALLEAQRRESPSAEEPEAEIDLKTKPSKEAAQKLSSSSRT